MGENADRIYAEIVLINLHDTNHFYSSDITSQQWQMNVQLKESLIKHLIFKDNNSFSFLKIIFEIRKIKGAIQNLIFGFFSKYVNMADINALWKKYSFFKVHWLGPKFNALWKIEYILEILYICF